jgi:hypothetical protein
MLVPPDTETDYDGGDNYGDDEQYWPNLQNPSHSGFDEKSRECQHEGCFQNLGD